MNEAVWVPEACTLPIVEQPARLTEFDDLFATALQQQQRISATRLRWQLDPAWQETAQNLTARESACCTFFTFSFSSTGDLLVLDIDVPAERSAVLDALAERATARIRT